MTKSHILLGLAASLTLAVPAVARVAHTAIPDAQGQATQSETVQTDPLGTAPEQESSMPASPSAPAAQTPPTAGPMTAPPADAAEKDYPKCSRTVQDNCVNPGAK